MYEVSLIYMGPTHTRGGGGGGGGTRGSVLVRTVEKHPDVSALHLVEAWKRLKVLAITS